MTVWEFVLVVVVLALAGMVKGVTGFGLQLFATPIMAAVFGARQAILIMSIPHLALNLVQLYESREGLGIVRELWSVAIVGVIGVMAGLWLFVHLDQNVLALVIAGVVCLSLVGGDRILGTAARARIMGPIIGAFSGLLSGAVSISGPLLTVYLHAKHLKTREFVAAVAIVLGIFSVVQVMGIWQLGLYDRATVTIGLLSFIPTLLAFAIGARVRDRIDNGTFRIVVSVVLALSAINLLVQGLRGLDIL